MMQPSQVPCSHLETRRPITKEPVTFTRKVERFEVQCRWAPNTVTPYRSIAPIAPPAPTARKVLIILPVHFPLTKLHKLMTCIKRAVMGSILAPQRSGGASMRCSGWQRDDRSLRGLDAAGEMPGQARHDGEMARDDGKKQPLGVELFQEVLVVGVLRVVAEGVVAAVGEDYVVNNRYFKNFACLIECFSHLCICKTWSRIS